MSSSFFFFFNDTATTEIYTLSLHDALPISHAARDHVVVRIHLEIGRSRQRQRHRLPRLGRVHHPDADRKSTRLNSSHGYISYAVFCLKKKKKKRKHQILHQKNSTSTQYTRD